MDHGVLTVHRALLLAWLVAGCYAPNLDDRKLLCGGDKGDCPSPLVCGCDGRCHVEPLDAVVEIRGGDGFACARRANGTVVCAGKNDRGELGDGTEVPRATPAPVSGLGAVTVLAVGTSHSCTVDRDGVVACWGANGGGQLGDGSLVYRPAPVTVSLPARAVDVAVGGRHSCALLEIGDILCWGDNSFGQLGRVGDGSAMPAAGPGLGAVIDIAAAGDRSCARTTTNDLWCWGANDDGELGVGDTQPSATPLRPIGLDGQVIAASLGLNHTCVVTSDDRALCWGDNDFAQLANGTNVDRHLPEPFFASETGQIAQVVAGGDHTCLLRVDGTAACVGNNNLSQLGDGTAEVRLFPVPVTGLTDAIGLGLGPNFSCAWHRDGTSSCWGANLRGQLGNGEVTIRNVPAAVPGLNPATAIAVGYHHTCAQTAAGLACWGRNDYGQLGDNTDYERHVPTVIPTFSEASSAAPGYLHSCAVRDRKAWCWGRNTGGQLGDGSTADRLLPTIVLASPSGQLTNVVQVVTGFTHSCALVDNAGTTSVYCWGRNDYAQLGADPMGSAGVLQTRAIEVAGLTGVTRIAAGTYFTCALRPESGGESTVLCWGYNGNGQLGNGTPSSYSATPVAVQSLGNATQIATGYMHTCAVTADHQVFCWGRNMGGELGQPAGVVPNSPIPIQIAGLTAMEVQAGLAVSCARLMDDSVSCWGTNAYGELGDGSLASRATPEPVANGLKAVELAAKYSHGCARAADGTVSCWGFNANGQLGDGTTSGAPVPIATPFSCPASSPATE
ncbi:MAG: RCC1 repeat-containing protein [Kofleriaceae bacterium]